MKFYLAVFLFLVLTSCEKDPGDTEPRLADAPEPTVGTVLETINVETYTYIRLGTESGDLWLATSRIQVERGDTLQFTGGILMRDFRGISAGKTFDQILFVGKVERVESVSASNDVPTGGAPDPHAGIDLSTGFDAGSLSVDVPDGGITIAELLAEPGNFSGQKVKLRGKVVKVNANIMGKNWVTFQDGTGIEPENQLTATTRQTVSVGDVLTLTAVVQTDIDLGYGYEYKVLLEDAVFE